MKILVIGGNRFVGFQLVWRLIASGHDITIVNRGTLVDPFGQAVQRIAADRKTPAFEAALANREFDAVVDFALYTKEDAHQSVALFGQGRVRHYICISSGQVYLVREHCPLPAKEEDFFGRVMEKPTDPADLDDWIYGVQKREAEEVLMAAWEAERFPATRLRIPVVNGERDHHRRLESYIWRILDRQPLIVPDGENKHIRQVYGLDVARTIQNILCEKHTFGQVYNLAQDELISITDMITLVATCLGTKVDFVDIPRVTLEAHGLSPRDVSPFHSRWTSVVDPTKAKAELAFSHTPLERYIDKIVSSFISHPPAQPPNNYRHRLIEHALIRQYGRNH